MALAMKTKLNKLVVLKGEKVFVRAVVKHGRDHYDPELQDILMLEGREALRELGMRHYHGFLEIQDAS